MLRDMFELVPAGSPDAGRGIASSYLIGMLGSEIAASAGSGQHGAGLLANDSLDPAKRYRLVITSSSVLPFPGYIDDDGAIVVTSTVSGTYRLLEDNAWVMSGASPAETPFNAVIGVTAALAAGAYAIGGEPAAITAARPATADTGQYAVAGLAASIVVARAAAISAGAYTIDGRPAAVSAARLGAADAGAYAIAGLPAQLAVVGTAGASLGVYSISGAPALVATTALAHNGAYVIDGAAALTHRAVPIDAGVYAIGGQPASFAAFLATTALPGSYAIAGLPAQIRVGTSSGGYASAADVWSYVLANGKTAEQNMVENNTMLSMLLAGGAWGAAIEGSYTAADLLRICAAVLAGRSRITSLGNGRAHVEFDAVGGADLRVAAEMNGSERQAVALTL